MVQHYTSRTLYTCCNIFAAGDKISDANYRDGALIPLGSPVTIEQVSPQSITFTAGGKTVTLQHLYGTAQEPTQKYFDKILVTEDRNAMVAKLPPVVQRAIREGRVENGMKRVEVLLSVGFPPTDDNPSPTASEWTLWHSKGKSYKVAFDAKGYVSNVAGRPAPTNDKPVRVYKTKQQ
jgi:hypothetical protein